MSRIPRFQELLKNGFTAEAVSAARFRAFAARAEQDGLPHLARRWTKLAETKDRLAVELLVAAEQVRGLDGDLGIAIAEERYENDVLYPKMVRDDVEGRVSDLFRRVVTVQQDHLRELEQLREELNAAQGDVRLPLESREPVAPLAPVAVAGGGTPSVAAKA